MPSHILVTGAHGYIGQQFCQHYSDQATLTKVSLRQTPIDQINFQHLDCVLHLSALVHSPKGEESEHYRINCEQTVQLAKAANQAGVKQFVFFSTMAVYGGHGTLTDEGPLTEQSPCQPTTAYGKSKYQAEQQLQQLNGPDFKVAIVRPPMVYGSHCPGNMMRLKKLVAKSALLPFGYPQNRRSLVSIDNLLAMSWQIIQQQAEGIYLPQDPEPVSIQELAQHLAQAQHRSLSLLPPPQWLLKLMMKLAPRQTSSLFGNLYYDNELSCHRLEFSPPQSTQQGIQTMCQDQSH